MISIFCRSSLRDPEEHLDSLSDATPLLAEQGHRQLAVHSQYEPIQLPPDLSRRHWLDVMRDWSGTGQRLDVDYEKLHPLYRAQLRKKGILGKGRYGEVFRVKYRQVDLARKCIMLKPGSSPTQVEEFKKESSIGQKLDRHRHIIKLVGSYSKGPQQYNILFFPVAVCDLGRLLDCWEDVDGIMTIIDPSIVACLDELDLGRGLLEEDDHKRYSLAQMRMKEILGCLVSAMLWMHSQGIHHRDLKPANILLRRAEVFVADFGISRDRAQTERTTTDYYAGHSWGYAAPEVVNQDWTNPRESDVFSLGCVFLYILTFIYGGKYIWMADDRDGNSRYRLACFQTWLEQHYHNPLSAEPHPFLPDRLVKLVAPMVSKDRKERPSMPDVDKYLRQINVADNMYYGACCIEAGLHEVEPDPPAESIIVSQVPQVMELWSKLLMWISLQLPLSSLDISPVSPEFGSCWSYAESLKPSSSGLLLGLSRSCQG